MRRIIKTSMVDLSDCLGYCRVSTQRQFTHGHGLERYLEALKNFGLKDEQIFWDIESGSSETRRGYNTILQIIRQGKCKRLIIPCFDRFTRSPLQWEKAREELQTFSVKVEFLDGGSLDLETPEGLFNSRILAAVSAQVRDKNRYNSLQGHKYLRSKEKALIACFGYEKVCDELIINQNQYKMTNKTYFQIAREYIDLFLKFKTLSSTVAEMCNRYGFERVSTKKHLDFPRSHPCLQYWLLNPLLRGYIVYFNKDTNKRIITENTKHEPILSEKEYLKILMILEQNKKSYLKKDRLVNPLVGLCFCANCGSKMLTKRSGTTSQHHYLICKGAYPIPGKPIICHCRTSYGLKIEQVIQCVIDCIYQESLKFSAFFYASKAELRGEINESSEIINLKKSILKLEALNDTDLKEIIDTKKTKLLTLQLGSRIVGLEAEERMANLKFVSENPNFWDKLSVLDQYTIFQEVVDRVECSFGVPHVFLKIDQPSD